MAREEAKKGRETVRGLSRSSRTEATEAVPLVSAKRGKFESLKDAKIEAVAFAQLKDYKAFVREIEGEEPEDGAIVSAALEMLFKADVGFERWQQNERKKGSKFGAKNKSESDPAKSSLATAIS